MAAPNRARDNHRALRVDAMNLKNILGDIEPGQSGERSAMPSREPKATAGWDNPTHNASPWLQVRTEIRAV
ncbi:MAG: hypothetical protein ABR878_17080, partial [Roseiarcus sp.]